MWWWRKQSLYLSVDLCHIKSSISRSSDRPFWANIPVTIWFFCCAEVITANNDARQCYHIQPAAEELTELMSSEEFILKKAPWFGGYWEQLIWPNKSFSQENIGKGTHHSAATYSANNCHWGGGSIEWQATNLHIWWHHRSRTIDTGTSSAWLKDH